MHSIPGRRVILALVPDFPCCCVYWLVNMSFKTNGEIVSTMTLGRISRPSPIHAHLHRRKRWYSGYNQFAEICDYQYDHLDFGRSSGGLRVFAVSLPRDKHLFFWLCRTGWRRPRSMRCRSSSLFGDQSVRHAVGGGRWPIASFNVRWGVDPGRVRSGVPREIDETAFLDGYSFRGFSVKITGAGLIASGIGVAGSSASCSPGRVAAGAHADLGHAKPISAVMTAPSRRPEWIGGCWPRPAF